MPAMRQEVLECMKSRLAWMRDQMVNHIEFDMTHDECIELIAPPEHIQMLKDATKFADVESNQQWVEVTVPVNCDDERGVKIALYMRTHGETEPPLRPKHPEWHAGKVGGTKAAKWLGTRLAFGRRFGAASYALNWLAAECETGSQVRYLMPAIMHLAAGSMNTSVLSWAEKNAAFKPQKHHPAVPPLARECIREGSAIITSAVLMGEEGHDPNLTPVAVNAFAMPYFMCQGTLVARL